jgi:hypothetical protein
MGDGYSQSPFFFNKTVILERIEYVSSDLLFTVHLFAGGCFGRTVFVMVFGDSLNLRNCKPRI